MTASVSPSSSAPGRVWYLDLLRIAATVGVIFLHIAPQDIQTYSVASIQWKTLIGITTLFRWCVPVFLMISGALFLDEKRELTTAQLLKKPVARVAVSFIAWSAVYALVYCLINGKGKWTFLNQLLRGHYHMWYLFVILGLYMLTPVIRKITESKRVTQYFLCLGFAFMFLFPRLLSFVRLFDFPHADVVASLHSALAQANPLPGMHALYFYVLGHSLHTAAQTVRVRRAAYFAGICGYLLTVALTIWYSNRIGELSERFYELSSLTTLAMAVAVFLLFKHLRFEAAGRAKRVLLHLSACSYGVYLVHPLLIERIAPSLPTSPLLLILAMPLWVLAIYLISLVIASVLRRIPVLNRYIV